MNAVALTSILVFSVFANVGSVSSYTTISRLNDRLESGELLPAEITLEAYVVYVYECPPCPLQAVCKPCMDPHVIISQHPRPKTRDRLTADDLVVDLRTEHEFLTGERYRMILETHPGPNTRGESPWFELKQSKHLHVPHYDSRQGT